MIQPEFNSADEVLEYAARLIEEINPIDYAGVMARRKRDREDAALRGETARQVRKDCAAHIRAMKARPDLDAKVVLRRLAELPEGRDHSHYLSDAWPLAWKGWVDIRCVLRCNSNCIPPEATYKIVLTKEGQAILEADNAS